MTGVPQRGARLLGLWLAVAAFFIVQNVAVRAARGVGVDWQWDVFHELVYWLVWAAFTPALLAAARRWPLAAGVRRAGLVWHLGLMLVVAPLQIATSYLLHFVAGGALGLVPEAEAAHWAAIVKPGVAWGTFAGFLYYWVIVMVYLAARYRARVVRLEEQLARARLDALRAQLHPHFLFNTLNSISVLTATDPPRANRMLLDLSELLRAMLEGGGDHEITLERELALLERYVAIQQIRFGERLAVRFEVEPAARAALVPTLLLQPLVENAIRHGVDAGSAGVSVAVRATVRGERLLLAVEDSGPGLGAPPGTGEGIGLANARARLEQLFGTEFRLELRPRDGGGVAVRIEIPVRRAEA
jgi:two-component sensor histidine kinase